MNIYFIRHGEGEHNVKKLWSLPHFELTEAGKKQAEIVGERVSSLPIELIISSPFTRTRQTTEIINQKLNRKVIYSDLVAEIKRPSEIAGKSMVDPETLKVKLLMDEKLHLANWHYSDEENFFDLKKRAQQFLDSLSQFQEEDILVVSHVLFIQMAVMVMMLGEDLTPKIYLVGQKFFASETSGLTICEKTGNLWQLITWNDHAHLAERNDSATG